MEQQSLSGSATAQKNVTQIDLQTAMAYRGDAARIIAHGTNAEKKRLLSAWVDKIQLAPESLEVEIRYKIPSYCT